MEFKEAYKKGIKVGRKITNGEYSLEISKFNNQGTIYTEITMTNILTDKKFDLGLHKLFLDSLEDNWEIIREDEWKNIEVIHNNLLIKAENL